MVVGRRTSYDPSVDRSAQQAAPAGSGGRRRGTPGRAPSSCRTGPGSGGTRGRGRRCTAPGSVAAGG